ncbi:iron chelate uptake ABC transporter family permease subunit [Brachybacterium sacelli]
MRTATVCAVLFLLALILLGAALVLGDVLIAPADVLAALTGGADRLVTLYVMEWRLPRALAALAVGALLGAAGAIFQTLTRNPLGSPDIIGFTTGAQTGGLLVILVLGTASYPALTAGSVLGGLASAAVVMGLAHRGGISGFRLIIVGIALTAMLASVDTYLVLTAELDLAIVASTWGVGSLNGVAWPYVGPTLAVAVVLLAALIPLSRPLAQLDLGEDTARAIGARPQATQLIAIVLGVLLVAVAVAVAGPVAFIALAAPQIGRRLTASQGTPMLPAACTGAVLLLGADLVAQHTLPGRSLPVGLMTVSLGGLYLLYLIVRENRRGAL